MPAKMMKLMPLPRPALADQLAEPHEQDRAGGEAEQQAQRLDAEERVGRDDAVRAEQDADAVALREGQRHGQHAGVLVDPVAAVLALAAELLERGDHAAHQLHDDAGVDVRVHAEADDRRRRQAASREDVQDPEQRVVRRTGSASARGVHVRDRNVRQRPEDQQDSEREEELAPDVRRAEGGEDRLDQALDPPSLSLGLLGVGRRACARARAPPAVSARRRLRQAPQRRPGPRRWLERRRPFGPWPCGPSCASPRRPRPLPQPRRRPGRCPARSGAGRCCRRRRACRSAERLKAWAWIVIPFGASPTPRILTGSFVSWISPSCASTSGVTRVPLSSLAQPCRG